MERTFTESLGTRVRIEKNKEGGTVTIDFFSPDDLKGLLEKLHKTSEGGQTVVVSADVVTETAVDDRSPVEVQKEDNEEIYSLKNFSL